jgi:hypothetical protein
MVREVLPMALPVLRGPVLALPMVISVAARKAVPLSQKEPVANDRAIAQGLARFFADSPRTRSDA